MESLKKIWSVVVEWFKGNGVEGIVAIPVFIYFLLAGQMFYAGIALGVLACKNWELLKGLIVGWWNKSK